MFFSCRWDAVLQRRRRGENALPCNSYARSSGNASSGEALEVARRRFASSSDGYRGREDADDKQGYIGRFDTQERVVY